MQESDNITRQINEIRNALIESGYFDPGQLVDRSDVQPAEPPTLTRIQTALKTSAEVHRELRKISRFLHEKVIREVLRLDGKIREPKHFDELSEFLCRLLNASSEFKEEREFVAVYGELLSTYILSLYRRGSTGRESPIIRRILTNIARRKAIEMDHARLQDELGRLKNKVTISLIAKRYATFVLATRGIDVLFRVAVEFREFGTAPEAIALQITSLLVKYGVRLSDVTDIVCGGGDLGTLPDGIYVLTQKVRDESWKRLHNSSLNRGALIAWELRELLKRQTDRTSIHASLCNPLSFSTLGSYEIGAFFREEAKGLSQSLKGYVKVTPLKSVAALLSEILGINQDNLNLLVMALDGLFASVARKTGPRIAREMAAQEANNMLIDFDFSRIAKRLEAEGFTIPANFALASQEIGTGVREITELLMIVESANLSESLKKDLMYVVDSYARQVAMVLEMASAGSRSERPRFITIASMMALDPYFQRLFGKIRNRMDSPFTPLLCLDSLEHEYLTANHLFELYVNVAGDKRLHFSLEARSISNALQVLGATRPGARTFAFSSLLTEVKRSIADGTFARAHLVLVGADNEDALEAVWNAKYQGLLDRLVLIGNPDDIQVALKRTKVPLSPSEDPSVTVLPIDPLVVDLEDKKKSMAETFRGFLEEHPNFVVMKGSVDTAKLLHQALSIYHGPDTSDDGVSSRNQKMASHTALFELPDGRFFALSDAGVNPTFSNADGLVRAIENQVDVVRTVVHTRQLLKVAIITAVEKETKAIPATLLAAESERKAKDLEERYGPLIVEGPLSFDLATVPEVAEEKHYHGRIMGDANCLVATEINTANVLYKMLSKTMGSLGLMVENGAIITAGPGTVPIVLTSRGDTASTKFNSILLAMAYCLRSEHSQTTDVKTAFANR